MYFCPNFYASIIEPMQFVCAEIISVGDEILYGQILDTNSQWISQEIDKIGIKTVRKTTVSDNESDILKALEEASERSDIILMTGGLGPTSDDLTKPCLAKFFDCDLVLDEQALEDISVIFNKIGRELTETNRQQAYLPEKCTRITNRAGTAPGMWFQQDHKVCVSMPGVPHEMQIMMSEQVLPKIQKIFKTPAIFHKMIRTIGIGESWLSDKIKTWEDQLPTHIRLAYLPGLGEVRLRLTAVGARVSELETQVNQQLEILRPLIDQYIYGFDADSIPQVVGDLLRKQKLTIATAESCTGGSVAQEITSIAGSSDYFLGSVVAYQNSLKQSLLGVSPETLASYGAVSENTIVEMAEGVRDRLNADIGIATSGIAGPGGGSPEKPVGTVWIACSDCQNTVSKKLSLYKDREINIKLTTKAVLNMVRQRLLEMDGEKV